MKKDKLKPYVHKVKGAINYALYDLFNGHFYKMRPEGDVRRLRERLKQAGLIFETEGVVPFKIELDLSEETVNIRIRELQIRLNGKKEDTCWQRSTLSNALLRMNTDILDVLQEELKFIPIEKIRIEAAEPDYTGIEKIIGNYNCSSVELRVKQELNSVQTGTFRKLCRDRNIDFIRQENPGEPIDKLVVEPHRFFYSQKFNPCLGQKMAIDTDGEIKTCLWSEEVLGNIRTDNLKDMIIGGRFDSAWEMTKDKIEVCNECERRYACNDCRVSSVRRQHAFDQKPSFCNYNPYV